jgi:PIN domain nuclease of toxin-antitoxin system
MRSCGGLKAPASVPRRVPPWRMQIAIKSSMGKLRIPAPFERYIPRQLALDRVTQLEIDFRHVARVAKMPFHHRDPFDRLIIAQALEENLPVLSADPAFDNYKVKRRW